MDEDSGLGKHDSLVKQEYASLHQRIEATDVNIPLALEALVGSKAPIKNMAKFVHFILTLINPRCQPG
jgi:hypothetical protein